MERVRERLRRVARTDVPVLITGETGTGKTLAARLLHRWGSRSSGPFVQMNCAGIPDGLFESELFGHERGAFTGAVARRRGLIEQAHQGTLFLDELGELPGDQQAKLLTVLDEGRIRRLGAEAQHPVDIRLVSATLEDPIRTAARGAFRQDLLHRIAVVRIELPPLRERSEDIIPFALGFLETLAARHGFPCPDLPAEGRRFLLEHHWPGNVRELIHLLEAAIVLGGGAPLTPGVLGEACLPEEAGSGAQGGAAPPDDLDGRPEIGVPPSGAAESKPRRQGGERYSFHGSEDEERERIRAALRRNGGNRTHAAGELGMSRATLRNRIQRYDLT